MPKEIQSSFTNVSHRFHFTKKQIQSPFPIYQNSKTPPFSAKGDEKIINADQSLFEGFRSFYRKEWEEETSNESRTTPLLLESPRFLGPPPPENLRGSSRFFAAAGSSRPLIMDETYYSSPTRDSNSTAEEKTEEIGENDSPEEDDLIAILTYSRSPYEDFRRSMQEMVEARAEHGGKVDWEFLDELLSRYLEMNNEKFCRHILRAFVELAVVLRENSWRIPPRRRPWDGGGGRRMLEGRDL